MVNTTKTCVLSLMLIVWLAFDTLGQGNLGEGYIVNLENDTIYGQIEYRLDAKNYRTCRFLLNNETNTYSSSELNGFGYRDGKAFASGLIEGWFVEVLAIGTLSLYKYKDYFLIKKNQESPIELRSEKKEVRVDGRVFLKEHSKWKGIVSYLISDCTSLSKGSIRNMGLNENDLTRIVANYNNCTSNKSIVVQGQKPWFKIEVGGIVGVVNSVIKIGLGGRALGSSDGTYSSTAPTIGLIATLSWPRKSERLAFQPEIHFAKFSYSGLTENAQGFHENHIEQTVISMPLGLKYRAIRDKPSFYIQGGLNVDYHSTFDAKVITEFVVDNVVTRLPEQDGTIVNAIVTSPWAGVGFTRNVGKLRGDVALRYYKITGLDTSLYSTSSRRIALHIILYLK